MRERGRGNTGSDGVRKKESEGEGVREHRERWSEETGE